MLLFQNLLYSFLCHVIVTMTVTVTTVTYNIILNSNPSYKIKR